MNLDNMRNTVMYHLAQKARNAVRYAAETYKFKKQFTKQKPCRIVVGASGVFDEGWVPTDKGVLNLLKPGDWKRFFKPKSIDAILAEHVWELLTEEDGITA